MLAPVRRSAKPLDWKAKRHIFGMAIKNGYTTCMDVSIVEAKNRLTQLIRSVEAGETVVITRNGKPVAQLSPAPTERRRVKLGRLKDRVKLLPGWDEPIDLDRFLEGGL